MAGKKGASKGTGGYGRKRLQGRGPTPKAEERTGHPAARAAKRTAQGAPKGSAQGAARGTASAAGSRTGDRRPSAGRSSAPPRRPASAAADELIAGRNAVVEALRTSVPATTLYVATNMPRDDRVEEAKKLAVAAGLSLLETGRADLDRLTDGAPHQGVALLAKPFTYVHAEDLLALTQESVTPPLVVALDGVTDPHNLGAIARSAAAFGAHGLLVPERRAAGVTAAAWKASAGTLARLPVARVPNLTRAIQRFAGAGLMVAGLDGGGGAGPRRSGARERTARARRRSRGCGPVTPRRRDLRRVGTDPAGVRCRVPERFRGRRDRPRCDRSSTSRVVIGD